MDQWAVRTGHIHFWHFHFSSDTWVRIPREEVAITCWTLVPFSDHPCLSKEHLQEEEELYLLTLIQRVTIIRSDRLKSILCSLQWSFLLVDFMLSFCSIFCFLWRDACEVRLWQTVQRGWKWRWCGGFTDQWWAEWNQSMNQTLLIPLLIQLAPRNSPQKVSNCNFLSPTVTWMLLLNYINLWPGMKNETFS